MFKTWLLRSYRLLNIVRSTKNYVYYAPKEQRIAKANQAVLVPHSNTRYKTNKSTYNDNYTNIFRFSDSK